MPYKSESQRKFFNVNRKRLEAEGVNVDEWNQASKGKKLPEKKANTPGQTGNIPVTPPTPVRPEAAPSAHIPRPARRQTTLADMQGKQAMSTQKVDMPFFYLLAGLAKAAAQVKAAGATPKSVPAMASKPKMESPFFRTQGYEDLADKATRDFTAPVDLGANAAPDTLWANLSNLASNLGEFATSPLGIGTGIGLGALGTGMYLGSRRKRDEDEKEAGVRSLARAAAKSRIRG